MADFSQYAPNPAIPIQGLLRSADAAASFRYPRSPDIAGAVYGGIDAGIKMSEFIRGRREEEQFQKAYTNAVDPATGELKESVLLAEVGKFNPKAALALDAGIKDRRIQEQKIAMEAQQAAANEQWKRLHFLFERDKFAAEEAGRAARLELDASDPRRRVPLIDTYDPATGQTVRGTDAPGAVRPPKNGLAFEFDEGGQLRGITQGGAAKTQVTAEARELGKAYAEQWGTESKNIGERYDAAMATLDNVNQLTAAIGDAQTGKFTTLSNDLKAAFNGLGITNFDETKIGDLQYAEKLSNDFALAALKSMGGNDTEFEYKKQLQFAPGPDQTRRRIELTKKMVEMQVEQVAAESEESARLSGLISRGVIAPPQATDYMRKYRRALIDEKRKAFAAFAQAGREKK